MEENGVKYIGDFYFDIQHGHGKEIHPDGKYYEGDFECGVKNGFGEIFWPNGDKYSGEFVENKISGKGKRAALTSPRGFYLVRREEFPRRFQGWEDAWEGELLLA